MKKTPWFSGDVKPARAGVYERRLRSYGHSLFSRWDGKMWWRLATGPAAAQQETARSGWQLAPAMSWRGLAAPAGKEG